MRSDYPNSDLINKVNSEWINNVLLNPELGRADPVVDDDDYDDDDDDDLALQRNFTERPSRVRREPEPVAARFNNFAYPEPSIAVKRMARASRRRSVTRRVIERLVLGVAVLVLVAGLQMTTGFHDATDAAPGPGTSAAAEGAPEIDTTAMRSSEPAWLSPEILYATAIPPSLARRAEAAPFLPRLGR